MNKHIMRTLLLACLSLTLAACETMPPSTYSNYGDNTFMLRKYTGAKVRLGSMNDLSKYDSGCRLVGPIKTAGNRPMAQFVQDSFNDELKFSGLYSDDPDTVSLTGTLQTADFTSMTGMTSGHWTFSLQLANSANGRTLGANYTYEFDSGFVAETACRNVSNALTPAVQRLINKAVSDPSFGALIAK